MRFENRSFLDAVGHLLNERPTDNSMDLYKYQPPKREKGELILPEKAKNYKRIYWYLCTVRGIEPEIVSYLMKEKKIYQQAERGNCVFVGYDENKIPKYCSKRGTSPEIPYKSDHDNSDKGYPFSMEGTSNRLFVTESPIDVMAHASLCKIQGIDYRKDHRISLGCLSDRALEWYLKQNSGIRQIILALDNDFSGRNPDGSPCNHGQEAAKKFCVKYADKGYNTAIHTPIAKDFAEDLINIRKVQTIERESDRENEDEDEDELIV